jgi:O-antigen/teichoic acid export membrane protein
MDMTESIKNGPTRDMNPVTQGSVARTKQLFETEHLKADLKGRSVRGGIATMLGQAATFVVQTASTVVLARLLTPEDYGMIAMITAVTGFVTLFKDLGLSMATVQKAEITHEQVTMLFWINVALSAVVMLIVMALAPVIAWFYGEPKLLPLTLVMAIGFVFGGLCVQHSALLRRQMQFGTLALIDVLRQVVSVLAGIIAALAGAGVWSLVYMPLAASVFNVVAVWIASPWRPGLPARHADVRGMLGFGANLTGFSVLNYFTRNADNVIVGYALGSGALGIYSKAYGLLEMPMKQINAPLNSVMLPALSRLQTDPDRYRRYYLQALAAIAMVTMPIVTLLFVIADDVVLILLGSQWTAVVTPFRWLAPAAFFGSINFAPGWLCVSLGRTNIQLRWAMLSAPAVVAAFLIGVNWGINAVAAAFSVTWCALFVLFLVWACHRSPVRFQDILGSLAIPLVGSFTGAAVTAGCGLMYHSGNSAIAHAVVSGLVFGVSYLGCLTASPAGRELLRFMATIPSTLRAGRVTVPANG